MLKIKSIFKRLYRSCFFIKWYGSF